MIYLDNIIYTLQNSGGISKYWHYLNKGLLKNNITFANIIQNNTNNIFNIKNPNNFILKNSNKFLLSRYFPLHIKENNKFIFHSSYYRYCLSKNAINIVTVHDFIYEKYRLGLPRLIHSLQKNIAIKKSTKIICNSFNTKKDLFNYYPKLNEKNIEVIHMGVDSEYFYPLKEYKAESIFNSLENQKFFLFIGNPLDDYKNFNSALALSKKFNGIKIVLVSNTNIKKIKKKFVYYDLRNLIIFKNVSDIQLNFLYNKAICLFYFSIYEGFGMPIIEAMMSGCPVISINNSSISELIDKYPIKITNQFELIDMSVEYIRNLDNKQYRLQVINEGLKISKEFTWDKCIKKTLSLYDKILSNS